MNKSAQKRSMPRSTRSTTSVTKLLPVRISEPHRMTPGVARPGDRDRSEPKVLVLFRIHASAFPAHVPALSLAAFTLGSVRSCHTGHVDRLDALWPFRLEIHPRRIPKHGCPDHTGRQLGLLLFVGGFDPFLWFGSRARILFFETAATIITLIFLGNLIEHRSVARTTSAIRELNRLQPERALRVVTGASGAVQLEPVLVSELRIGDKVQVNEGDRVPVDGRIVYGSGSLDESFLTGESLPVDRTINDSVTGGSIVVKGNFR